MSQLTKLEIAGRWEEKKIALYLLTGSQNGDSGPSSELIAAPECGKNLHWRSGRSAAPPGSKPTWSGVKVAAVEMKLSDLAAKDAFDGSFPTGSKEPQVHGVGSDGLPPEISCYGSISVLLDVIEVGIPSSCHFLNMSWSGAGEAISLATMRSVFGSTRYWWSHFSAMVKVGSSHRGIAAVICSHKSSLSRSHYPEFFVSFVFDWFLELIHEQNPVQIVQHVVTNIWMLSSKFQGEAANSVLVKCLRTCFCTNICSWMYLRVGSQHTRTLNLRASLVVQVTYCLRLWWIHIDSSAHSKQGAEEIDESRLAITWENFANPTGA